MAVNSVSNQSQVICKRNKCSRSHLCGLHFVLCGFPNTNIWFITYTQYSMWRTGGEEIEKVGTSGLCCMIPVEDCQLCSILTWFYLYKPILVSHFYYNISEILRQLFFILTLHHLCNWDSSFGQWPLTLLTAAMKTFIVLSESIKSFSNWNLQNEIWVYCRWNQGCHWLVQAIWSSRVKYLYFIVKLT